MQGLFDALKIRTIGISNTLCANRRTQGEGHNPAY
jgi:hypothetical protein